MTGLKAGTQYSYQVSQGSDRQSGSFQTSPDRDHPVRFLVYSDPEMEPESTTSPPVDWPVGPRSNRPSELIRYVADQTTGYRQNLGVMAARKPQFILLTGDLVETGGEQRDWDEFWRHNAGKYGSIASNVPILAAIGNHENFAGPGGGYSAEGANFATDKYLIYFEVPPIRQKSPIADLPEMPCTTGLVLYLGETPAKPDSSMSFLNSAARHELSRSEYCRIHTSHENYRSLRDFCGTLFKSTFELKIKKRQSTTGIRGWWRRLAERARSIPRFRLNHRASSGNVDERCGAAFALSM